MNRSDRSAHRREQIGWYFYDWANSAFSTTVVTVFLGPYLTALAEAAADADRFIYPIGIKVKAGSFFPYIVSLSVFFQAILLPVIGAIADYSHRKKEMLGGFAYLGATATIGLYFLTGTNYLTGGLLFLIANVSFGASIVLYNAFLPEIAPPDQRDSVSSKGWALGYLGGGLLLAMNLLLLSQAPALGLTTGQAVRISLASAGVWWALFTLIPMTTLRRRDPIKRLPEGERIVMVGFKQLRQTFGKIGNHPQTLLFLSAYLLYNDGIQTVITLASQFGQEALGIPISTLTGVILMVQFVAFGGALLFDRVAQMLGTKKALLIALVIWTAVLIDAYFFLQTPMEFYLLAAIIAVVMGGSQALSRSLYSQMIPRGQEAEYFSLYEMSDRGTSWLGPLFFGLALQFTGSYHLALSSLVIFFLAGLALLWRVDFRRAALEAGNPMECGGLPPLSEPEQAPENQSGSKLPHSK